MFRSRIVARLSGRAKIAFSDKGSLKFFCAAQQKGLES
jgi:hypothetical protein